MLPDALSAQPVVAALVARGAEAITGGSLVRGEMALEIAPGEIVGVCTFLKHELEFNRLSAVTAVDRYPAAPRFEVIYHLHSLPRNERLRLKCFVGAGDDGGEIDSVTGVWAGADWYEREVYDLFGVKFRNHPDMTRIMMPDEWVGHPLRKDYPVHGHKYSYQSE